MNENEKGVEYDDSTYSLKRGRRTVLTDLEDRAIVVRMKEVSEHGFAASNEDLKAIAAEIADDGRVGFPNGYPSDEWVKSFRARHRDITYRKMESREGAKIAAHNPEHVQTLVDALKRCQESNPDIFHDPHCVWNMDEMQVSLSVSETEKGYVSADTHHGGMKITCDNQGKHLTAVVIASAAGDLLPPFFMFAGAYEMKRWYNRLSPEVFKDKTGIPHFLASDDWFPKDAFVTCSDNGSMTKELIPFVIEHIKAHAPRYTHQKKMLLPLDGHKSRNGYKWLSNAKEANIEVIQSPANTSHFLQACDQSINKQFKKTVRETYNALGRIFFLDFGDFSTKFKLGIAAFKALTPEIVQKSFTAVGLWPMNYSFLGWAEEKWNSVKKPDAVSDRNSVRIELHKQWKLIIEATKQKGDITFKMHNLQMIMVSSMERVKFIVSKRTPTKKKIWKNPPDFFDRTTLNRGAPAFYLTHGKLIEQQQMQEIEAEEERRRKEKEKEEAVIRKQEIAAEKERKRQEAIAQRKVKAEERAEKKAEAEKRKKRLAEERSEKHELAALRSCKKKKMTSTATVQNAITKKPARQINVSGKEQTEGNAQVVIEAQMVSVPCFGVPSSQGGREDSSEDDVVNGPSEAVDMDLQKPVADCSQSDEDDAIISLLRLHNVDTNILKTHRVVFDESVGTQECLDDPS